MIAVARCVAAALIEGQFAARRELREACPGNCAGNRPALAGASSFHVAKRPTSRSGHRGVLLRFPAQCQVDSQNHFQTAS